MVFSPAAGFFAGGGVGPAGQTAYGCFGGLRPPAPAQPGRPAGRGFCSSPTRRKGRIWPPGSAPPPVFRKGQVGIFAFCGPARGAGRKGSGHPMCGLAEGAGYGPAGAAAKPR